jgi:hypothetical protein
MSPSHANKKGVRYRYYVSQAVLQNRKDEHQRGGYDDRRDNAGSLRLCASGADQLSGGS